MKNKGYFVGVCVAGMSDAFELKLAYEVMSFDAEVDRGEREVEMKTVSVGVSFLF